MNHERIEFDAVVIGAGLAGSAAAMPSPVARTTSEARSIPMPSQKSCPIMLNVAPPSNGR